MCAFVYGLNDADERVRRTAAYEIGCQVRRHPCCCSCQVTSALICALGDCDWRVRRCAERALCACGYEVTNCCNSGCQIACNSGCNTGCNVAPSCNGMGAAPMPAAAPAPAPAESAAPAPAPPEPEAYFPSRIQNEQTNRGKARNSLANLFGLR